MSTPPVKVAVAVNRPGATIPSTFVGVFFEDINFAADGGIYPERVKNRSFEFPDPLMGWRRAMVETSAGRFAIQTENPPSAANQHYLRITSTAGHPERRTLHRPPSGAPRRERASLGTRRVRKHAGPCPRRRHARGADHDLAEALRNHHG